MESCGAFFPALFIKGRRVLPRFVYCTSRRRRLRAAAGKAAMEANGYGCIQSRHLQKQCAEISRKKYAQQV